MTPTQKEKIDQLRLLGMGYKTIAKELCLTVDMVKGYCKRHNTAGRADRIRLNALAREKTTDLCLHCGTPIRQTKRGRHKKFCSFACRHSWWNKHPERRLRNSGAIYQYTCNYCGKKFSAYGNKHRKYCSHACYIKSRFWRDESGV